MRRIKLCVLQDKGIQTVLLINQRKTVPVYQYWDVAVQAVWRIGGWSFHVTQSASPLYQLHKKEIEPGFHCVIALEGQRIRFYAEELCANALRFHGYALEYLYVMRFYKRRIRSGSWWIRRAPMAAMSTGIALQGIQ